MLILQISVNLLVVQQDKDIVIDIDIIASKYINRNIDININVAINIDIV